MPILVQNNGEARALEYFVNRSTPQDLSLRLFTNNITPAETDTTATYTEAAGGGYAPITLAGASWTVTPGAPSTASFAQRTWTFTGPLTGNATVFGYFMIRGTGLDIMLAETFTSFQPTNNGDQILLTPQITAD